MARLNIDERSTKINQGQVRIVHMAVEAAFTDLGLSDDVLRRADRASSAPLCARGTAKRAVRA